MDFSSYDGLGDWLCNTDCLILVIVLFSCVVLLCNIDVWPLVTTWISAYGDQLHICVCSRSFFRDPYKILLSDDLWGLMNTIFESPVTTTNFESDDRLREQWRTSKTVSLVLAKPTPVRSKSGHDPVLVRWRGTDLMVWSPVWFGQVRSSTRTSFWRVL